MESNKGREHTPGNHIQKKGTGKKRITPPVHFVMDMSGERGRREMKQSQIKSQEF
jgi:hypothetical protein